MGMTEEENPQQQRGPVTSLGTQYQEGWGTTMHCLEYQHSEVCKISRLNPLKHRDALGGSYGGDTLTSHPSYLLTLSFPWGSGFLLTLSQHAFFINIADIGLLPVL